MTKRRQKRGLLFLVLMLLAGMFAHVKPDSVRAGFPTPLAPPPLPVPPAAVRPTEGQGTADLVVLISVDGLRPDAITENSRGFHRLLLQGAAPHFARTIDKSATLPSHASMVSGVDPSAHGLDFNSYKPEHANIARPTIFSEVSKAGLPAVMYVGKSKLRHLLGHDKDAEFHTGGMFCDKLLKVALGPLREARRGVFFLHFADTDGAGHRFGWMTDEYLEAVQTADRCLERVLQTIDESGHADRTLVIVTSDHGGHNRSHGTRLDVDQHIPWYAWGAGVRKGRIHESVHTTDTAATVLAALGLQRPMMHGKAVAAALMGALGPDGLPLFGEALDAPAAAQ